jgi:excisionase family DNA binding protein
MDKSSAPIGLGIAQVCATLGIGRTSVYGLIKVGRLRAVKIGRRTIVLSEDLQAFVGHLKTGDQRLKQGRGLGQTR